MHNNIMSTVNLCQSLHTTTLAYKVAPALRKCNHIPALCADSLKHTSLCTFAGQVRAQYDLPAARAARWHTRCGRRRWRC